MRARLAALLYRLRWPLSVGVIALCVGCAGLGAMRVAILTAEVATLGSAADPTVPKLFDPRYAIWFGAVDETLETYRTIEGEFGAHEIIAIAFEVREGDRSALSKGPLSLVQRLSTAIEAIAGVVGVQSLATALSATELGALLEASDAAPIDHRRLGRLLSSDRRATALYVTIDRYHTESVQRDADATLARSLYSVDAQRAILRGIEEVLAAETAREGYQFHIAGFPINEREFERIGLADSVIQGSVFIVFAAILWFVFRRWSVVFIVLATVAIGVIGMVGAMLMLGDLFNNLTIIAPLIVTVVGIAGAIHLVSSYSHARENFQSKRELVTEVIRRNLPSMSVTALTTAAGFFSLMVSGLSPVRALGYSAGIGTIFVFALSMTLVPAALSCLPLEFRARPVKFFRGGTGLSLWVVRHRLAILGVATVLCVLTSLGLNRVELQTDTRAFFPKNNRVIESIAWIDERLGGFGSFDILIDIPECDQSERFLLRVAEFEERLLAESGRDATPLRILTGATSPVPALLAGAESDLATRCDLRVLAHVKLASSEEHLAAADRIRAIAAIEDGAATGGAPGGSPPAALSLSLSGKFLIYAEMFRNLKLEFIKSMLLALGVITVVIGLTFRSPMIALISAVPNALPVLMPMAAYGLLGWRLDGPAIFVSSIALGICVDDTVHFLLRYREERASGRSSAQAVGATFEFVGRPIITTTLVIALGFSVMALAQFRPNVAIGQLAVIMVALALIADFVLTPALLLSISNTSRPIPGPTGSQDDAPAGRGPGHSGREVSHEACST